MPFAAQQVYLERLERRLAEYRLLLADAVSMPYADAETRRNALKHWQRIANPTPAVTVAPRGALALRGVFVEFVPVKRKTEN